MSSYCFDIDGTICTQAIDYIAQPYPEIINAINRLYEDGHRIILYTARGSVTGIDWRIHTKNQLEDWGVKYHELRFGKPEADYFIDDKGLDVQEILGFVSTGQCPCGSD